MKILSWGRTWRLAPLLFGGIIAAAIACGGEEVVEKIVVQTVVVEKVVAGETVKVVETVIVEKPVTRIEKVAETVIVEKAVTRVEKVVETVIVEKVVAGETVKVVETVIVEKPVTRIEKVVETVIVEKIVAGETVKVIETVVVEKAVPGAKVVETVIVEKFLIATATPGAVVIPPKPGKVPSGTLTVVNSTVGKPHGDPEKCIPGCGNEKFTLGGYETLLFIDKDGNVVPRLATSWVVANDLSNVVFKLQPDVEFHGGWGTMTAEDVAWGFNRANPRLNPDSIHDQAGDFSALMERMDAIDDLTLLMTVNEFQVGTLRRTLSPFWQSMGVHSKKVFDEFGSRGMADVLIGTGSFQFVTWVQDERAVLNAVEGHWRKTPEMATVRVLAIPEPTVRATMLKTGETDIAALDIKDIPAMKAAGFVAAPTGAWAQGIFYGGNYWEEVVWGTDTPVDRPGYDTSLPWVGEFGNDASMENARLVREAMSRTIDRLGIVENVTEGLGFPNYVTMVSVRSGNYQERWTVPFEPEKGKALLAEAGYADGFDVELWGGGDPGSGTGREITEAIAAGWQNELGLNVTLDATVYSAHRPKTVEASWNQLQFRIARDTNTALTLDLPKGAHASTKSLGGSICAGQFIPKYSELHTAAVNEQDAEKRKTIGIEVIDYAQKWWLETGVLELPNFVVYNGDRVKEWPRPLSAFAAIWFNLEEITWQP